MPEELTKLQSADAQSRAGRGKRLRKLARHTWPFPVGMAAALLGLLLYNTFYPAPLPLSQNDVDNSIAQVIASVTPLPAYSSLVYQTILPSLVLIKTEGPNPENDENVSVGSGVVINESGLILTALHVVDDAVEIEIIFADGTKATAEIITAKPENDIAVLAPSRLPELIVPAILGNPNAVRVGDEAFAVGNPLGLAGSMSAGVISGFERSLTPNQSEQRLEGLIQFDAAVNPGNSGGPLLNRQGQVIGIVTALANPSEQNFFIGIGFAVPIKTASSAAGAPDY